MEFLCNISSFVLSRVNNFLSPRVISLIKLTHYWTIALLMCPFHGDNFLGYKFIKCHVTLYVINVNISDTYTYRYLQKYISQIPWPMMMTCIIFFYCVSWLYRLHWRPCVKRSERRSSRKWSLHTTSMREPWFTSTLVVCSSLEDPRWEYLHYIILKHSNSF